MAVGERPRTLIFIGPPICRDRSLRAASTMRAAVTKKRSSRRLSQRAAEARPGGVSGRAGNVARITARRGPGTRHRALHV